MLWLSFPPVGAWWLAWLAPVPLIWLVLFSTQLGRVNFREVWLAGLLYWLGTFYFIPLPHRAMWAGWFAVSLYMSIYTPLFVLVSRTLVHRFYFPVILAAPIAWTGIEWIRCNFATGMAMVCLSHSQFKQPILIQIADLSGAYTLTFAIVMFAAGVAVAVRAPGMGARVTVPAGATRSGRLIALMGALLTLAIVVSYGQWRLREPVLTAAKPSIHVAIVQSSIDVIFESQTRAEELEQFEQYCDLTGRSLANWPELDLIVWPESGFPRSAYDLLSDIDAEGTIEVYEGAIAQVWGMAMGYPALNSGHVPLLVGATTLDPQKDEVFNSALLINSSGAVAGRYFKNHRVMFGEYVPLADWFPFLHQWTPIGRGLTPGKSFESFEVKNVRIAPSICFESTVPQLMRRMVNTLTAQGKEPDVLINLTNDGWFFGTSCLDLHLACNVFRAVELRKPHLVCANTGFSAEIDTCGRLLQVGPRRDVGLIKAEITPVTRTSLYRTIGDWIPAVFGWVCGVVWLVARFSQTRNV